MHTVHRYNWLRFWCYILYMYMYAIWKSHLPRQYLMDFCSLATGFHWTIYSLIYILFLSAVQLLNLYCISTVYLLYSYCMLLYPNCTSAVYLNMEYGVSSLMLLTDEFPLQRSRWGDLSLCWRTHGPDG